MPEIKCFCHCHIGKWISSLDCQCFHGMHQTKCSHCESPKPAQLAEEKFDPVKAAEKIKSLMEKEDQSPLTQEDRELLEGWPEALKFKLGGTEGLPAGCNPQYFSSTSVLICDLLAAKDREADEMVLTERNRCASIVQQAREGEIDSDLRSIRYNITNP